MICALSTSRNGPCWRQLDMSYAFPGHCCSSLVFDAAPFTRPHCRVFLGHIRRQGRTFVHGGSVRLITDPNIGTCCGGERTQVIHLVTLRFPCALEEWQDASWVGNKPLCRKKATNLPDIPSHLKSWSPRSTVTSDL